MKKDKPKQKIKKNAHWRALHCRQVQEHLIHLNLFFGIFWLCKLQHMVFAGNVFHSRTIFLSQLHVWVHYLISLQINDKLIQFVFRRRRHWTLNFTLGRNMGMCVASQISMIHIFTSSTSFQSDFASPPAKETRCKFLIMITSCRRDVGVKVTFMSFRLFYC